MKAKHSYNLALWLGAAAGAVLVLSQPEHKTTAGIPVIIIFDPPQRLHGKTGEPWGSARASVKNGVSPRPLA